MTHAAYGYGSRRGDHPKGEDLTSQAGAVLSPVDQSRTETVKPNQSATPRLAVMPAEAAQMLGVSRDFFDEHIGHELPVVRRGRLKLFPIRGLERWLDREASVVLAAA
mgnify:CR=1 FL=1